jgi:hypothetical protein
MPQFDLLTLSTQVFGLLICLYFFYYYGITTVFVYFIETKKIRNKKLRSDINLIKEINKDIEYNSWLINYSYLKFLK